jgi:tRNA1Val (adenine37-N6)-methyltransferase
VSFFQFKKFIVYQDHCAMKVSTDACIFGAYIPLNNEKRILDIGTGTGLLSLMLAQRCNESTQIDAVELDKQAAKQAQENVNRSIWKDKITVFEDSIQNYSTNYTLQNSQQYDLIVCNPPFFVASTLPPNLQQQIAHHTVALSFEDLWHCVTQLLDKKGKFAVLLPITETTKFTDIGTMHDFVIREQLAIQDSAKKTPHRFVSIYQKNSFITNQSPKQIEIQQDTQKETLLIKNLDGTYSQAFTNLLKDYYFYL